MQKRGTSLAARATCAVGAALVLASCQASDFQFNTPRFDVGSIVPPDPDQFARKQRTLQPVGPTDLVDASGSCAGGDVTVTGTPSEQASDPQATPAARKPGASSAGSSSSTPSGAATQRDSNKEPRAVLTPIPPSPGAQASG